MDENEQEKEIEFNIDVLMKEQFKEKIDWFSSNYENEICGFIVGSITEEGIILEDLLIPKQEAGTGTIDLEGKNLVKLRQEYGDLCRKIIGEWHSHNSMGCFWSSTDEDDFIEPFSKPREISVFVVSSESEHLIRIEVRKPFKISLNKIPYIVEIEENEKISKLMKEIIKEKVTEKTYTSTKESFGYQKSKPSSFSGTLKYFHREKEVKIGGISWYIKEAIEEEYKHKNPKIEVDEVIEEYTATFKFGTKEDAIDFIKDIKRWLRMKETEEDEINTGFNWDNEERGYNGYGGFHKSNRHF